MDSMDRLERVYQIARLARSHVRTLQYIVKFNRLEDIDLAVSIERIVDTALSQIGLPSDCKD
jgi:hypothetical protein